MIGALKIIAIWTLVSIAICAVYVYFKWKGDEE